MNSVAAMRAYACRDSGYGCRHTESLLDSTLLAFKVDFEHEAAQSFFLALQNSSPAQLMDLDRIQSDEMKVHRSQSIFLPPCR